MASRHKVITGDGPRWRAKWRNPDGTQCSFSCHTAEAADKVLKAAEAARDAGRSYLGPQREAELESARVLDLRTALTAYLKSERRRGLAESSIEQANKALTRFLVTLSETDDEPIPSDKLTTAALSNFYDHMRITRGCSLETARSNLKYVERWWKWLFGHEEYEDRVPKCREIQVAAPTPKGEPCAPTWDEMDLAIACATGFYAQAMTFARFTGLRVQDQILQLRLSDINQLAGTLRIRPELGKTSAEKRGRTVPLSRHLLAQIPAWPIDEEGWLIHVPPSERHGDAKRVAWNDGASGAWRRAGVRPEVWDTQPSEDGQRRNGRPLHAFRKGFVTGLQAAGVPLEDVQYLVGHKGAGGVTTERYTDPNTVRKLKEAVERIPAPTPVQVKAISGGGRRAS